MNPAVVRTTQSRGKHIKTLIEQVHILYKDFNEDIFDHVTGLKILDDEKQELETIYTILRSNALIKELFMNESELSYRSLQCKSATEKINRYVKILRQRRSRVKRKNNDEYNQYVFEELTSLSKKSLIKQLIKHLNKKEIEDLIKQTQGLKERSKTINGQKGQ
ncbi:hypothetical protein SAMN03159341_12261 [Paenibacillus sp. 1_12]|uniref:hypothetical protein n=1 Tax=Paenibacillus sp. 1_12 TaxID=1566278 RepID=UPI0008F34AD6|nr:hypothetical protein [Paenibacillus sp. 1_12]SFM25317.1 hypothetical protein SAMN03159341_12261 [Paenibacillus sp. 1_12]